MSKDQAEKTLAELRERYPKAFPLDPEAVMPLMLHVHKKLIAAGYDRKAVSAALGQYVNAPAYLKTLAAGKPRVNLDGEPVGFVSEVHQTDAKEKLENPAARKTWKPRPRISLAGTIAPSQEPPKRTPMPQIELTAVQAKIAFTIDTETFRAVLNVDTTGAKSVTTAVMVEGKKYVAQLNPKSFRKAVTAFREAANPVVTISGNLKGNSIEAAGIQVFDKGAKAAETTQSTTERSEPTPQAVPPRADSERPKLALKPKASGA
jgi:sRNA-binding protein